jgi:hypothetical protein
MYWPHHLHHVFRIPFIPSVSQRKREKIFMTFASTSIVRRHSLHLKIHVFFLRSPLVDEISEVALCLSLSEIIVYRWKNSNPFQENKSNLCKQLNISFLHFQLSIRKHRENPSFLLIFIGFDKTTRISRETHGITRL